jgi:hypothetical protein
MFSFKIYIKNLYIYLFFLIYDNFFYLYTLKLSLINFYNYNIKYYFFNNLIF